MKRLICFLFASFSLSFFTAFASAEPHTPNGAQEYLVPYAGIYNVTNDGQKTVQLGLEYRFADVFYGLRPTVGANVDHEGAVYGYGGLNLDIPLSDRLTLTPNFMAGLYSDGNSQDMGGPIEFRSGLELSYLMDNQHRIGVAYNHISNASIYDKNPGAETLLVSYALPFNL